MTRKKVSEFSKESYSENQNNQEIVPVDTDSDNSGGDITNPNIKALPNSSIFRDLLTKTLGRLRSSPNSLRRKPSSSGATVHGVSIYNLEGDKFRIRGKEYDLNPEIFEALSLTGYTGATMTDENDNLMMYYILNDSGYTGIDETDSKRKTFFTITLPKLVEKIQNRTFKEITLDSDSGLQGEGVKIVILCNTIDFYTRLEILLGLKLSGHTDTLTEASNLID